MQVLPAIYCGHEFTNVAVPSYAYSSMYYKGVPRNGSPPWRPDDKDGHYVFVVGDNITPRCTYIEIFSIVAYNFSNVIVIFTSSSQITSFFYLCFQIGF